MSYLLAALVIAFIWFVFCGFDPDA